MPIEIEFLLKPHQLAAMQNEKRFEVRVWARRSGKTFYTIARQVMRCLGSTAKDWRAYYIAPTRVQAKAIAWDYLTAWLSQIPGIEFNLAELRVDFPNGSRLQLLGGESYDSLRGRYADDVTLDECAHIPSAAWTQVISPMLADRQGRCTFTGTPNGRLNLLYQMFQDASSTQDPEWSASLLDVYQAQMLAPGEIDRMKRQLSEPEFNQELLCSWDAALLGSYYAKEMAAVAATGRMSEVRYDKSLPVTAAVDLGWSDGMAVIWGQQHGTETRIIAAKEYHMTSIPDMIADFRKMDWPTTTVVLPHDAQVHELGSGKTRRQVFHELGCTTHMAPNQSVHEGIDQVRRALDHMWFDYGQCKGLIEALNSYRSKFDEVKGVHSVKPLHDWSSHYADAMRYFVLGRPMQHGWGPRAQLKGY